MLRPIQKLAVFRFGDLVAPSDFLFAISGDSPTAVQLGACIHVSRSRPCMFAFVSQLVHVARTFCGVLDFVFAHAFAMLMCVCIVVVFRAQLQPVVCPIMCCLSWLLVASMHVCICFPLSFGSMRFVSLRCLEPYVLHGQIVFAFCNCDCVSGSVAARVVSNYVLSFVVFGRNIACLRRGDVKR